MRIFINSLMSKVSKSFLVSLSLGLTLLGAAGCQDVHAPSFGGSSSGGGGFNGGGSGQAQLSYSTGIKDLFENRCGKCHAAGAAVPDWGDYQTAYNYRSQIYQKVVVDQSMPLQNVTGMTQAERGEIAAWVNDGAPEQPVGPAPTPEPTTNPSSSPSGSPDPNPTGSPTPAPINTVTPPDYTPVQVTLQACLGCHVKQGNSEVNTFPRLAGQQPQYLINELQAFHNQSRTTPLGRALMWDQAAPLGSNDMQLLALYFWFQTPTQNLASTDPARVARGKDFYNNGIPATGAPACSACHGSDAHGSVMAPRLAGQNAQYVQNQFTGFRAGQRPEATTMPAFAPLVTDDQVEDIANYLQTLQ